jgi:hypothetical protein
MLSEEQKQKLRDAVTTLATSQAFADSMENANYHHIIDEMEGFVEHELDKGVYDEFES